MYNKTKIKAIVALGILLAVGFIGMIGFSLGNQFTLNQATKEAEKNASIILEKKSQEEESRTLSSDKVREFLIQYYTKKKLGENNSRIKSFLTESAYGEELKSQELAVNKVNKEFIVDYVFEDASIFINSETKEAIAEVHYRVTYLSEVSNGQQFKNTQSQTQTIKLGYVMESDKLLVNQVLPWQINLTDMLDGGNRLLENGIPAGDNSSSPKPSKEIEKTPVSENG